MAGYRQARNLLPVSQGDRKAPQTEDTHDNSSSYVNAVLIVLCMSNGLICAYNLSLIFMIKKLSHHVPRDICCKQLIII